MNRSNLAVWRTARTLEDLGRLGARWIGGDLTECPAYWGPSDIETLEMIPVLIAANQAGYFTIGSQAGAAGTGQDGVFWEQRAAVEGFASRDLMLRIVRQAARRGLFTIVHDPATMPRFQIRHSTAVTVTNRAGQPYTQFGAQLSRRHLRDGHAGYGDLHRQAVRALCSAWQVTVIDPQFGREHLLWDTLASVAQATQAW
jgi:hypothetical protein